MKTFLKLSALGTISISLFAANVHAEDSYKFFGTLDYGYYKGYDDKSQFGSMSRSDVGFNANKDLTPDLAATVKIDTRFFLRDPSNGNYFVNEDPEFLGSAEATVGLKGSFGHVRVGRALTAVWGNDWAYDAWYNYDSLASPAWWSWHGNSPADPNASSLNASFPRLNNGLFYASPVFGGGFSVDASYGMKTQTADVNHSSSIAFKYSQKEFGVMYGREKTPAGNTFQIVAGKVNFGDLSLMGAYDDESIFGGGKNRSATVSGRYSIGVMSYMLGFGRQVDYHANFYSAGASYAYKPNINLYVSYGNQAKGFWGSAESKNAMGVGVNYSF
jgi:hypothetical protein